MTYCLMMLLGVVSVTRWARLFFYICVHLSTAKFAIFCHGRVKLFPNTKLPPPKKKLHHSTVWTFFALICCRNCNVCWKKTENKRKRGWGWSILKIITKWAACKLPGRTHLRRTSGVRQCCLPWRWPYRLRGSETGGTKCYAWPAKRSWSNHRVPLSTKIQFMENYNWNPEMDSTLSVSLIKLWLNKFGLCKILKLIKFTISGFVCVFHPVVLGLNPKHSIHTFSIYSLFYYIYHCIEKRTKINKRKPSLAHFKNNNPHASINLTNYSVFK